ncbi:hypothetical protein M5362_12350 [Streptomyces sp. Je 1-79]|uniref:hypothetical protein n=1 Tax=Streptomyces sp. Je 1-79 TaxID=2943847 RepID=UPI0021A47ABF|nr:hypothetical protein [Streptomyces sp. Je 1-79]MCT4353919.1 hypothetical protein [Streptomyces sp. Je 1-79]
MIPKNATTAAALVGGYLLGRTKKAKMAIGVGMFLAGRRLDLDPRRIGKLLAASPVTGALSDQVRRELVEATKSAATQALTRRATGLADTLQRRTQALGGTDEEDAETDADVDDEAEDAVEDDGTRGKDEGGEEGKAADTDAGSRRKSRARPAAAAKTTAKAAAKTAAKKKSASEGSRSTSRGGPSGGGTDRTRRTSTTARKRASAPRKSSASATRKSRSDDNG